jgi:hypothetical protein
MIDLSPARAETYAVIAVPQPAAEVLQREFLEMRCKILELASSFDRLERGAGAVHDDPRVARLREALEILLRDGADRAEQVQLLFSRPYDDAWQKTFDIAPRR